MISESFLISNIFFLTNNTFILSVQDLPLINEISKYDWAIFINDEFDRKIKFTNEVILKTGNQSNERALETTDNLSDLKEIDLKINKVSLRLCTLSQEVNFKNIVEQDQLKSLLLNIILTTGNTYEILREYKIQNGSQASAYKVLEEIRAQIIKEKLEEKYEDRTLEIMDVVWGWCNPADRIWDTVLKDEDLK